MELTSRQKWLNRIHNPPAKEKREKKVKEPRVILRGALENIEQSGAVICSDIIQGDCRISLLTVFIGETDKKKGVNLVIKTKSHDSATEIQITIKLKPGNHVIPCQYFMSEGDLVSVSVHYEDKAPKGAGVIIEGY